MALFQNTYEELREAFVRARFAEKNVFGWPDIEEWLAEQREAERPAFDDAAEESYWNRVLCIDQMMWAAAHRPLTILTEFATAYRTLSELQDPQSPPRESPFEDDVLLQFVPLFSSFASDARVYYGHIHGAIVVTPDMAGQPYPYTVRAEGEKQRRRLVVESFEANPLRASLCVMDVLFAEWLYGRPRWREARQSICKALADEIKTQREVAEADFDAAVAVSADGTKIVHADWVVVMGENEYGDSTFRRDIRFPASAFLQRKILRTRPPRDEYDRRDEPYTLQMEPDPWDNAEWSLKRPRHTVQWLFESARAGTYPPPDGLGLTYARATGEARCRTPSAQRLLVCTDGRVLFVHRDQCPNPLPDGGVKVGG